MKKKQVAELKKKTFVPSLSVCVFKNVYSSSLAVVTLGGGVTAPLDVLLV